MGYRSDIAVGFRKSVLDADLELKRVVNEYFKEVSPHFEDDEWVIYYEEGVKWYGNANQPPSPVHASWVSQQSVIEQKRNELPSGSVCYLRVGENYDDVEEDDLEGVLWNHGFSVVHGLSAP